MSMFTGNQPIADSFFLEPNVRGKRYIYTSEHCLLRKYTPREAEWLCHGAPKRKS